MSIGDFTNSESAYLIYIKIMEGYFGNHSLEVSNCFFLIGVFYLEEVITLINLSSLFLEAISQGNGML